MLYFREMKCPRFYHLSCNSGWAWGSLGEEHRWGLFPRISWCPNSPKTSINVCVEGLRDLRGDLIQPSQATKARRLWVLTCLRSENLQGKGRPELRSPVSKGRLNFPRLHCTHGSHWGSMVRTLRSPV